MSLHTDRVVEALSESIVIANHAVLMAHRDALAAVRDGLTVFFDEAHELEGAATQALSASVDYQAIERVPNELVSFTAAADAHPALARLGDAAGQLQAG